MGDGAMRWHLSFDTMARCLGIHTAMVDCSAIHDCCCWSSELVPVSKIVSSS